MAADLDACAAFVASILNVTRGGYANWSTKVDPLHPQGEIDAAVSAAAMDIIEAIYSTPGHRYQITLKELRTTANGELVLGPIGDVLIDGVKGHEITASKLRKLSRNSNSVSNTTTGGYYCLQKQRAGASQVLNFLGGSCQVETLKDLGAGQLIVPDEYEGWVKCGGLGYAYTKQGTNTTAAGLYMNAFLQGLQMIRSGAIAAPAITGREHLEGN